MSRVRPSASAILNQRLLIIGLLGLFGLAGCAHFESRPISPAESAARLESRSLTNDALKGFLKKNLQRELTDWPPPRWEFDLLTLAAFYYHPDPAIAPAWICCSSRATIFS